MQKRKVHLILLGILFLPFFMFSQEKVVLKPSLNKEEKSLKFQEFFFKALSEKAINHYQNAIQHLENCNEIFPNNKAVLFELSKNYLFLNKTLEATEYAKQALKNDPENQWILTHLITVYKRDSNFSEAIKVTKLLIKKHPKKKEQLVFLYLQNQNYKEAKKLLQAMENERVLSSRLKRIKNSLNRFSDKKKPQKAAKKEGVTNLEAAFNQQKTFSSLKKLLLFLADQQSPLLLKYSKEGLSLFPAQPYVYLMNGKALNLQKKYNKALESLQNGIDFVIDNPKLIKRFYKEMLIAYKGLGKMKEVEKIKKRIQ